MYTAETYDRYQQTLQHIREGLKPVHRMCENTATIERANRIFQYYLARLKREAFDKINTMDKPHIIYMVNRYYHLLS